MNILVADDHKIMREGLKELIETEPDFKVLYEAENGLQAIELCLHAEIDVVIMDISMPKCNGIDAIIAIKEKKPMVKTIVLSVHSEKAIVKSALESGADAYLLKNCAFKEICNAIKTVVENQKYISPLISSMFISDFITPTGKPKSKVSVSLSARERVVLQRIAEGYRSKDIAHELCTGVRTIERIRSVIMGKIEVYSIAGLTKYAIRYGLTTIDS